MKSLYTQKIEKEHLEEFLPDVNMSDRDKEIVRIYLHGGNTQQDIGDLYGISRERIRQIIEKFARKADHLFKKKTQ